MQLRKGAREVKKGVCYALALVLLALIFALLVKVCAPALRRQQEEDPAATVETPDPVGDTARAMLAEMTREEKVWQMLVLFPQQLTGDALSADTALWAEAFSARPAGGIVFDGDNMAAPEQLRSMLAAAGGAGSTAPLLCVDEEGGSVARVAYAFGVTTDFKPMFTYREGGTAAAYANAKTIGGEIADFGFNVDFAPVADVWTNPDNTVIGRRAYSDDPAEAAALVAAAVRGFHDGGVGCVLKHFPGHGDTAEDSHLGAARSGKTAEELADCELIPFAAGLAAGADMVMVGHITVPAVDPERPATLSRPIVTGLLRDQLGFDGVVITDAMRMGALTGAYDGTEAAVLAVEAGCDLLLAPEDPDAVAAALLARLPEERIDESVLRILKLKLQLGIIEMTP